MTNSQWHEGTASVILLPGGITGTGLVTLVEDWTKAWMLKPAFWISEGQILGSKEGPPRIRATIIGRNGSQEVDLFSQLSRLNIQSIRVIAARVVNSEEKLDKTQDLAVEIIERYMEQSRPISNRVDGTQSGVEILKVNLVFAPTEQTGASFLDLLESHWDVNLVVAPEDRSTPTSFDGFTRHSDSEKMNGFILSNIAATAGIWSGQQKSIFEIANKSIDLSSQQDQVRVIRTFVRGVLSEGLSVRVAAEALRRAGNAGESKLDSLRPIPNTFLAPYEHEQAKIVIDQMVKDALDFQNSALKYSAISLDSHVIQKETGVFNALRFFGKSTWSLIKVLPLWFFAAFWNFIARVVSNRLFGSKGREVVRGTMDFPKTDLDKDSARNLLEILDRRRKIIEVLESWPRNTLRKSEPGLWLDLRRLILGRLDGSALPVGLMPDKEASITRVIGDLNQVLPSLHEKWELPSKIRRTLESDRRDANWQEMDVLVEIEEFLKNRISTSQSELDRQTSILSELDKKISEIDESLRTDSIKLEEAGRRGSALHSEGVS